ncbi:IclR family transcriptional regulator [Okibacterium endophyticum]
MARNGGDARSVAQKVFAIADAFDRQGNGRLTLTEIAGRAGLPLSTAHRLAAEWVQWGGLVRGDDGLYSLGMRFWKIGVRTPTARLLRTAALPFLEDLVEVTRQNVNLAVRDGLAALYLERLSTRGAVPIISDVGSRLPLHATGVGLVLLAFSEDEVLDDLLDSRPQKYLPNTQTTEAELRPRLADIRATGLAVSVNEMSEHTYSVASPIRDRTGDVVAAVSIIAHPDQRENPEYPLAVRVAGRGISRALGWRG